MYASNCNEFINWDTRDDVSWLGTSAAGTLFDSSGNPKPAAYEVAARLQHYANGYAELCATALGTGSCTVSPDGTTGTTTSKTSTTTVATTTSTAVTTGWSVFLFVYFFLSTSFQLKKCVSSSSTQVLYGQCGGTGWTGCTACATGSTCTYGNACTSLSSPSLNHNCDGFDPSQIIRSALHEPFEARQIRCGRDEFEHDHKFCAGGDLWKPAVFILFLSLFVHTIEWMDLQSIVNNHDSISLK